MEDKSLFGSSQPRTISEGLQNFIDSMVEEIVLEGRAFDTQKKYLKKFSENEGVNYEKLEADITTFIEILDSLKTAFSKLQVKLAEEKGKECHISEETVKKLVKENNRNGEIVIDWSSIKWDEIEKIKYRYRDRSIHPLYHRSYTIIITNNNRSIDIDSYGDIVLSRSYSNDQKNYDNFKESLARTGIYMHEKVEDDRDGITTLFVELYDGRGCVFSGHTTGTEGGYGNMYLPRESVRLFHDAIPENVGEMINKTIEEAVNHKKDIEER